MKRLRHTLAHTSRLAVATVGLLLLCACTTVRVTDPPRTATEQFLISEAATRAAEQLTVDALRDRKVYVDSTYFVSVDQAFALGEIRARLLASGVRLVNERTAAQIILEVRSGGIGIDRYEFLLGIPSIYVPGVGASTPELAILKNTRQRGYASLAYVAYWRESGEVVAWSGPQIGRTVRQDWWIGGYGPRTSGNIPPAREP